MGSEEDVKRASRINDVCIHPICSSLVQLRLCHFDAIWDKCCLFSKHTWDLTHRCNQSNEAIVTTVTRQRRKCDVRFLLLMMRWDRNRQEAFFVERKRTANGRAKGRVGKGIERRYGQSNATWNQQDINGQGDASSKLFWVFLSGKDQCYLYVCRVWKDHFLLCKGEKDD